MADENTEEKQKGGILKLLMFVGGGILLVGIGLGVGFFLFGGKPADPSVEIEEIIERKMKEAEEAKAASRLAAKNEEALYNEFKARQAFDALDSAIDRMGTSSRVASPE